MKVLIFLESTSKGRLKSIYREAAAFARETHPGCELHGLALQPLGGDLEGVREAGFQKVFQLSESQPYTYDLVKACLKEIDLKVYGQIVAVGTVAGRDLLPRLSGYLKKPLISELTQVITAGDQPVFLKPMYAGKCFVQLKVSSDQYLASPRVSTFTQGELTASASCELVDLKVSPSGDVELLEKVESQAAALDLTEAVVVISGGRSLGSAENFCVLESLSKVIPQSTVGASRAAVDSGYASHDKQVGQTGKTVSPKLYLACGISGAIQHLAGMRTSGCIVAINTDPEAPIFKVADYGIVGDLFVIVPLLEEALAAHSAAA